MTSVGRRFVAGPDEQETDDSFRDAIPATAIIFILIQVEYMRSALVLPCCSPYMKEGRKEEKKKRAFLDGAFLLSAVILNDITCRARRT